MQKMRRERFNGSGCLLVVRLPDDANEPNPPGSHLRGYSLLYRTDGVCRWDLPNTPKAVACEMAS